VSLDWWLLLDLSSTLVLGYDGTPLLAYPPTASSAVGVAAATTALLVVPSPERTL
jgi:hypothetical protein